jgi:hypothetical protein
MAVVLNREKKIHIPVMFRCLAFGARFKIKFSADDVARKCRRQFLISFISHGHCAHNTNNNDLESCLERQLGHSGDNIISLRCLISYMRHR